MSHPGEGSRPVVDPKRTNLKARVVAFADEDIGGTTEPGGIEYHDGYVILSCPGCGHTSGMRVGNPKPAKSPSWELTGTQEKPTFRPSINCTGCCGWHGWLTDGVYTSC